MLYQTYISEAKSRQSQILWRGNHCLVLTPWKDKTEIRVVGDLIGSEIWVSHNRMVKAGGTPANLIPILHFITTL
jgi:hypothetical protein